MMRMIDAITDKPNWVDKIRVAEIREKWRQEFFASAELTEPAGISDGMVDRARHFAGFLPSPVQQFCNSTDAPLDAGS